MESTVRTLDVAVYPPSKQGRGSFDGGLITERKPIGFPGEGSEVLRVGPLFYWAWATAHGPGRIGLHPHRAFEIMSYVLAGEIGHYDTMGHRSRVGAGGAQVMQTGSGVSHEETMSGAGTEFFQIWFEPYLQDALRRPPTYAEYHHGDFPLRQADGVAVKTVIGEDGPISLVAEATMHDVTIAPGKAYRRALAAGHSLAALAVAGAGRWQAAGHDDVAFQAQDFSVLHASEDAEVTAAAGADASLRLVLIDVPTEVDYPLYAKR